MKEIEEKNDVEIKINYGGEDLKELLAGFIQEQYVISIENE